MPQLKPYLIRAIYQWVLDCDQTPYLLIEDQDEKTVLPMDFVKDGTIVLNIQPSAVENLKLENDHITFDARFHGKSMQIFAPIEAILAIFAQENGEGMFFDQAKDRKKPPKVEKKPNLHIIK